MELVSIDSKIFPVGPFLMVCSLGSFFEGTWHCFSTLTAVETPQGEDKADRKSLEFSRKQLGFTVPSPAPEILSFKPRLQNAALAFPFCLNQFNGKLN